MIKIKAFVLISVIPHIKLQIQSLEDSFEIFFISTNESIQPFISIAGLCVTTLVLRILSY
jgi:hypothetical protein